MSNTVPSGWSVHELGDLAHRIEGGGTPSRTEASFWNGDIPWATVKDLRAVSLRSTEEHITELGLKNSSSKLIPANTIIIATRMAVGKAVFFDRDVAINQDLKAFYPKSGTNWRFLLQWYLAQSEKVENLATGSTVKGIRLDELKLLPIDLPPLSEQQKIAAILSSVDDVIEKTRTQIDKLKDLKTGMMQELLTKGIGHTEFKDSPVGLIPTDWQIYDLGDLAIKVEGGGTPPRSEVSYWNGDIPWATVKDLRAVSLSSTEEHITQRGLESSSSKLVPAHTMIIACRMAVGKAVYFDRDVAINQDLKAFYTKEGVDSQFILHWYLYQSEKIKSLATGSTVKGIRLDDIRTLPIALPSLLEQQKIAKVLSALEEKVEKKQRYSEGLDALKQALMQDLLTGKVRVKVDHKESAVA